MPSSSLDNFLDQLVLWTRQVIETGRTPFRKVEVAPPILKPPCANLPHLTLWINRDSLMAGGLILLPERDAEEAIETGMALSAALGLKSFATWDRKRVTIWLIDGPLPSPVKTLPIAKINSAGGFRQTLKDLLNELKILSVSAAPEPDKLSAYWLANLIQLGLTDSEQEISDHQQTPRASNETVWPGGERPGLAKGLLTSCRLLAVGHANLLARTVQAEGLERALRFAVDQLPEHPGRALDFKPDEPALPETASTRFHHLWRRIQQLDALAQRDRLARAIELLQPHIARLAPEAPSPDRASAVSSLVVNPPGAPGVISAEAEVGLPAIHAWRELLRWLQNLPFPQTLTTRIDELPADWQPKIVSAAIHPTPTTTRELKPLYETRLRLAWPSRRFQLPATTPTWHYDLLQLLGRAAPEANLRLRIPDSWLDPNQGEVIWDLLRTDFRVRHITHEVGGWTHMDIVKGGETSGSLLLEGDAGCKTLPWKNLRQKNLQHLQLALTWPQELYELLEKKLLLLTDDNPWPTQFAREICLFWRSCWGRKLAGWCTVDPDLLTIEQLSADDPPIGAFPHPDKLQQLTNLLWDPTEPFPAGDQHDADVALWVGPELANPDLPEAPAADSEGSLKPSRSARRSLVERIEHRLLSDGLPQFPEHYLYDHYRPQLEHYDLKGPLKDNGRFFGQIELRGDQGQCWQVDSEALAGCLLLASHLHQEIELPTDADIAGDILNRYLNDLRKLHRALDLECRRSQQTQAEALRLTRRLWKRWALPDWELVEQVSTLFSDANFVE